MFTSRHHDPAQHCTAPAHLVAARQSNITPLERVFVIFGLVCCSIIPNTRRRRISFDARPPTAPAQAVIPRLAASAPLRVHLKRDVTHDWLGKAEAGQAHCAIEQADAIRPQPYPGRILPTRPLDAFCRCRVPPAVSFSATRHNACAIHSIPAVCRVDALPHPTRRSRARVPARPNAFASATRILFSRCYPRRA